MTISTPLGELVGFDHYEDSVEEAIDLVARDMRVSRQVTIEVAPFAHQSLPLAEPIGASTRHYVLIATGSSV